MKFLSAVLLSSATLVQAATLPGFGIQPVATVPKGFISSIAADSHGILYYTTTAGDIGRFIDGRAEIVAHVGTEPVGNSGLLGLALKDDATAIIHYTTPLQVYDVVSSIDVATGKETVIQSFVCNEYEPQLGASAEHHGGNPIVADDGSIFVSIGDGNTPNMASMPTWNLGKIFRIYPDGRVEQFARGLRNPFDFVWDAQQNRLIAPDNGDKIDDEINIVRSGDDLGWPFTMGDQPAVAGTVAPVYVFPSIVAPTGMTALGRGDGLLAGGYLLGAFVTRALYYIDDIDDPSPVAILKGATDPIIDVIETRDGLVYFATGRTIYRLRVPERGDCNGDGSVSVQDLGALLEEVGYGPHRMTAARASWGCEVNGDGLIDGADVAALKARLSWRTRAVRSR
jgi:hypothetical protein